MQITIEVPATLSNLGPGFDLMGMAVGVSNRFDLTLGAPDSWSDGGKPVAPAKHLVFATAQRAAAQFGAALPGGLSLLQAENVPRARGLGSSATARVAGFIAWSHFTETTVSTADALAFLSAEEGHPDNAVAAFLGGLTIATTHEGALVHRQFAPPKGFRVALCIPAVEISTDEARKSLPTELSRSDVVFETSHLAFLMAGLLMGDAGALRIGVRDRLHHPYRAPLIGPVDEALKAAEDAGAACAFISGSGSTLGALIDAYADGDRVAHALAAPFSALGILCTTNVVDLASKGAWPRYIERLG